MSEAASNRTLSLGALPWTLSATELRSASERVLADASERLHALVAAPGPRTVEGFLAPLERILTEVRDVSNHGGFVFCVHPDEAVRTAAREASEAADRFFNAMRVNDALYRGLKAVDLSHADETTRFGHEKLLREMRRSGVEQDADARARLLALSSEVDRVCNQFAENIAKYERSIDVDDPVQLTGLPADYLASHRPSATGKIHLTTKYPDVRPLLAYCDDADTRRRMVGAFMLRAYPENSGVLSDMLTRRYELARSLGYPNFASFALEDRMVTKVEDVSAFLQRLAGQLREPALGDLRLLLARKRRDLPAAERLEAWDGGVLGEGYYDTKLKAEQFGLDTKLLRAYLPYPQVRDGLFRLCEELFGLTFERLPSEGLWQATVESYDVRQRGVPLGRIFFDMVPRTGKFTHAACFGVREGRSWGPLPQSALVCNFLDPTVPPEKARMEYSDVITFFHEFGHLLHALFSGHGPWLYTSGSYIEWDFIEAPSQLFEEWARDPATLARFARNPDTGESIPADLLARLRSAESLNRGVRWLRQVALASISLELYARDAAGLDPEAVLRQAYDRYFPVPFGDEYHPETSFGHLAGYSACYYTYAWSLVIARDLLSPFHAKGSLTDPETARRYAEEILTPGGSRPARELVRSFLGRDFSFDAFERWVREDPSTSTATPSAAGVSGVAGKARP
jgi:thimet oligopeptidase